MSWSIPVSVCPDESLSSWLVRAALAQGCDPMSLTGSVWGRWRAWTRDIDRGIDSQPRLQALCDASGIPMATFAAMALRPDIERVRRHRAPGREGWPWLVALGRRNRAQKIGQPFCPACLADDPAPYFRRAWRFAWNSVCIHHRLVMRDRCDGCGGVVQPHLNILTAPHAAICATCESDLRSEGAPGAGRGAQSFAAAASSTVHDGSGELLGETVDTREWFESAGYLVRWVRAAARREDSALAAALETLGANPGNPGLPVSGLRLENLCAEERHTLLSEAGALLSATRCEVAAAFQDAGLCAGALFDACESPPAFIRQLALGLPRQRRARSRAARSSPAERSPLTERAVRAKWALLRRRLRPGSS